MKFLQKVVNVLSFKNLKEDKKGIGALGSIALAVGVGVLIMTVMAKVLTSVQATQTAGALDYNVTGYGLTAINTVASNTPLLALIFVLTLVIGAVLGIAFFGRGKGGQSQF